MKHSPRAATLFILLFFLLFNGVQVYLMMERVEDAKTKFNVATSGALFSTLAQYNKLKAGDSASKPKHALVAYSQQALRIERLDSGRLLLLAPGATVAVVPAEPAILELALGKATAGSPDLALLDSLYRRALYENKVTAEYRLDTFAGGPGRYQPPPREAWLEKRRKDFPYATRPLRVSPYANTSVFAGFRYDHQFFSDDLFLPMLAFAFIVIISNLALFFVYKTIRKQKRINEVKTDFINNITHEMKTPITIATAGIDTMEHHVTPTERTSFYLHTSRRQLQLLNEFVERILESAVQDLAGFNLKKEKVDLHALFDELIQSHSLLPGKPVRFRLSGALPAYITGDRLHLQTALSNIIDNAVKYSNESVDINIDLIENNRDFLIRIRDNGIGIQPQFLNNIFEKFFRIPRGDAQPVKGFGLGLYYVHGIVKKHGGSIAVHSKWQSGTEFIITLPKNL